MVGDKQLANSIKRVLSAQFIVMIGVLVCVGLFHIASFFESNMYSKNLDPFMSLKGKMISALFGCLLAMAGTILAGRSISRVGVVETAAGRVKLSITPVFVGLINRLIIVGGGIGFGLVVLKLPAVYLIIGFLFVQFAQIWPMIHQRPNAK